MSITRGKVLFNLKWIKEQRLDSQRENQSAFQMYQMQNLWILKTSHAIRFHNKKTLHLTHKQQFALLRLAILLTATMTNNSRKFRFQMAKRFMRAQKRMRMRMLFHQQTKRCIRADKRRRITKLLFQSIWRFMIIEKRKRMMILSLWPKNRFMKLEKRRRVMILFLQPELNLKSF